MYTKLKQLIAATLSVFLLGTMSPTTAFAADHTSIKPHTKRFYPAEYQ